MCISRNGSPLRSDDALTATMDAGAPETYRLPPALRRVIERCEDPCPIRLKLAVQEGE